MQTKIITCKLNIVRVYSILVYTHSVILVI